MLRLNRFPSLLSPLALASLACAAPAGPTLDSPNGQITLRVAASGPLAFSVHLGGKTLVESATIGLTLQGGPNLASLDPAGQPHRATLDQTLQPVVPTKRTLLRDHCHQLSLPLTGGGWIDFRAYDDGVAYRFRTSLPGQVTVQSETLRLTFPAGASSLFPQEESLYSHYERSYLPVTLAELDASRFASLPLLVDVPAAGSLVFTEADLIDYPAMFLRGGSGPVLEALFPPVVLDAQPNTRDGPDRNEVIVKQADYLARTSGDRAFPWRVFTLGRDHTVFLGSTLVQQLSTPNQIADPSWIRPGRVAWDWWNANNLTGVPFEAGINQPTYKHYIDFAARHGLEYIILDEGWSASTTDIAHPNPDLDVPALSAYGAERGVGVILWVLWNPLAQDIEGILDLYRQWGVAGIKVDFMQRADQGMVNYYERVARAAADRRLLVDYHGAFKPAGLPTTWPNVISFEGVRGNETNKWDVVTPTHNLHLPFIRMLAGPMDYTPGAMTNALPEFHRSIFPRPMSMGTRAHEVAKYFLYESPLQMFCDSPSAYDKEPATTAYLARIPATWEETVPLAGRAGEFAAVARRQGRLWYLGAMTNEKPRRLDLDLSFLPPGSYRADIFADGPNAHRHGEDFVLRTQILHAGTSLTLPLAGSGGWSAILTPLAPTEP